MVNLVYYNLNLQFTGEKKAYENTLIENTIQTIILNYFESQEEAWD